MKRLYAVHIEYESSEPVAAENAVEAERIAKENLSQITGGLGTGSDDFTFTAEELHVLPYDWKNCHPYRTHNDKDDRSCKQVLDDFIYESERAEKKNRISKEMDEKQLKLQL